MSYDFETDVLIVGTGFAGLGAAVALKRSGTASFIVIERADGVGGTWRDNTYPGAACDISSHLYSFSFKLNPNWSKMFSDQPEILEYMRRIVEEEDLGGHLHLNTELHQASWDPQAARWLVQAGGRTYRARTLVVAAGRLSEPKYPDIPGLTGFEGTLFHSAAWDHDADLDGKRVGVVGTGASAIQIIPELAKRVAHLTVFQRSPAYIRPRANREFTEAEKRAFARSPELMESLREDIFWSGEGRLVERQALPALLDRASADSHAHREAQVDDPVTRELLKPTYVFGCKRTLRSNDFYPTFNLPHVTLEATGLSRVEGSTAYGGDGTAHELDVLVTATGFEATDLPIAYRIKGADGLALSDAWTSGMQAFATISPHGFPNLFVMGGPNTGLGHNSAIYIIESQITYVSGAVDYLAAHPEVALDVTQAREESFVRYLETKMTGTVWLSEGCETWYVDPRNGRLTALWPDYAHTFRRENGAFRPADYIDVARSTVS